MKPGAPPRAFGGEPGDAAPSAEALRLVEEFLSWLSVERGAPETTR